MPSLEGGRMRERENMTEGGSEATEPQESLNEL